MSHLHRPGGDQVGRTGLDCELVEVGLRLLLAVKRRRDLQQRLVLSELEACCCLECCLRDGARKVQVDRCCRHCDDPLHGRLCQSAVHLDRRSDGSCLVVQRDHPLGLLLVSIWSVTIRPVCPTRRRCCGKSEPVRDHRLRCVEAAIYQTTSSLSGGEVSEWPRDSLAACLLKEEGDMVARQQTTRREVCVSAGIFRWRKCSESRFSLFKPKVTETRDVSSFPVTSNTPNPALRQSCDHLGSSRETSVKRLRLRQQ